MTFKLNMSGVLRRSIKKERTSNTDFKKFDGVLREVISGIAEQCEKLNHYVDEKHKLKEYVFGIHVSNSALITCRVDNRSGKHYYFIDAFDGGCAVAALQMKKKMKAIR